MCPWPGIVSDFDIECRYVATQDVEDGAASRYAGLVGSAHPRVAAAPWGRDCESAQAGDRRGFRCAGRFTVSGPAPARARGLNHGYLVADRRWETGEVV